MTPRHRCRSRALWRRSRSLPPVAARRRGCRSAGARPRRPPDGHAWAPRPTGRRGRRGRTASCRWTCRCCRTPPVCSPSVRSTHPATPAPQLVFVRTQRCGRRLAGRRRRRSTSRGTRTADPAPNRPRRASPRTAAASWSGATATGRWARRRSCSCAIRDPSAALQSAAGRRPSAWSTPARRRRSRADQGAGQVAVAAFDAGGRTHVLRADRRSRGRGRLRRALGRQRLEPRAGRRAAGSAAHFHVVALAASAGGQRLALAETDPSLGDGLVLLARTRRARRRELGAAPARRAAVRGRRHAGRRRAVARAARRRRPAAADRHRRRRLDRRRDRPRRRARARPHGLLVARAGKSGRLVVRCDRSRRRRSLRPPARRQLLAPRRLPLVRLGRRRRLVRPSRHHQPARRRGGDDSQPRHLPALRRRRLRAPCPAAAATSAPAAPSSTPDAGWLEGPGADRRPTPPPAQLRAWPVALRAPLTAVATAPGRGARRARLGALAVGDDGRGRCATSRGAAGSASSCSPRAAPSASRCCAASPGPSPAARTPSATSARCGCGAPRPACGSSDPAAPIGFEGNLMGVAFDPATRERGYAVGKDGVLLRYGKTWTQEPLPAGFERADLTSDRVRRPPGDRRRRRGPARQRRRRLARRRRPACAARAGARRPPQLVAVAGAARRRRGRRRAATSCIERDGAGRALALLRAQPLPGARPRSPPRRCATRGGAVRAVVAVAPQRRFPLPTTLPPAGPRPAAADPAAVPAARRRLPAARDRRRLARRAAHRLRGRRQRPAGEGGPGAALLLDPATATAGRSAAGAATPTPPAAAPARSGPGATDRGRACRPPPSSATPLPALADGRRPASAPTRSRSTPRVARFAVAGHAECDAPCADLSRPVASAPTARSRRSARALRQLAGRPGGRARCSTPAGACRSTRQWRRRSPTSALRRAARPPAAAGLRRRLRGRLDGRRRGRLPRRVRGRSRRRSAAGPAPAGIVAGAREPGRRPRRAHALRVRLGWRGRHRAGDRDRQLARLARRLRPAPEPARAAAAVAEARRSQDARARRDPGDRDGQPRPQHALHAAAQRRQRRRRRSRRLLVDGGASAYLFERPEENRVDADPGRRARRRSPSFGTGTLGYRSPISDAAGVRQARRAVRRQRLCCCSSSTPRKRDPATNRAPVTVRLIPVIESLSLEAIDGTLLRRSRPALFHGLGRRPRGGDRWGPRRPAAATPTRPARDPYTRFPPAARACWPAARRGSRPSTSSPRSDPDIADFVARTRLDEPAQAAASAPTTRSSPTATSGLLCPFNAGTTTITVSAGGLSYAQQVTRAGGQRPAPVRHAAAAPGPLQTRRRRRAGVRRRRPPLAPRRSRRRPAPAPPPPPPPRRTGAHAAAAPPPHAQLPPVLPLALPAAAPTPPRAAARHAAAAGQLVRAPDPARRRGRARVRGEARGGGGAGVAVGVRRLPRRRPPAARRRRCSASSLLAALAGATLHARRAAPRPPSAATPPGGACDRAHLPPPPAPTTPRRPPMIDRLRTHRSTGTAALLVALLALVFSMTSSAGRRPRRPPVPPDRSLTSTADAVLRLDKKAASSRRG